MPSLDPGVATNYIASEVVPSQHYQMSKIIGCDGKGSFGADKNRNIGRNKVGGVCVCVCVCVKDDLR
jgi:hypothetical protein